MGLPFGYKAEIHRAFYADYLCRQWNKSHPYEKQLVEFEIVFMMKVISLNEKVPLHRKNVLWKQHCQ